MVFIQSQEYVDAFGKKSKNIVDMAGQSDYKVSQNPDTGLYDVVICMGESEKYLYTCEHEDDCVRIFKNILIQHGNKAQTELLDVNSFIIEEVDHEADLESLENMIGEVLNFMGYNNLYEAWRGKISEIMEESEMVIYLEEDETPKQLPNDLINSQVNQQSNIIMNHTLNNHTYIHYV